MLRQVISQYVYYIIHLYILIIISEMITSNLIIINLHYTAVYVMTIFKIIFEDNFYYKINILFNVSLVHISYRS